jgi:hypothetical protein
MDSNYIWAIFALVSLVIIFGSVYLALTGRLEMIDDSDEEPQQ